MEKILAVAKEITNPFSLLALAYLILFLLFRGVLEKAGIQEGLYGYNIITYLMTIVAVISVLTLVLVFGFKVYEVYQGTKITISRVAQYTEATVNRAIRQLKDVDLQVDYHLNSFSGANVLIGNQGQGIIIVSDLTIHWDYCECTQFKMPLQGAPLVVYKYEVNLTTTKGSKILDAREFKYGSGDIDKFKIDLHYPDYGVYTVWLSFKYKRPTERTAQSYETERESIERCERF
jgi:uncharacterized membrane protein